MNTTPTRRAALAGALSALPVLAGAASLAAPPKATAPLSRAVALAIDAHKAAQARIDAISSEDQDAFDAACDLEADALEAVAETPCESDADFFAKALYLIEREREAWGNFELLALATELHVKGESALEAGGRDDD
jgi:hypothetical protein